ncbi:MAG: hypothetical protein CL609_05135 [Anaerolineaceae bacterium]|nr:hypothetical protein [Anaerolineaceae bacterium]
MDFMTTKILNLEQKLKTTKDPQKRIDLLNEIAWELRIIDANRARHVCEQIMYMYEAQQVNTSYIKGKVTCMTTQCVLNNISGNFAKTVSIGFKALILLEQMPDTNLEIRVLRSIGWSYVQLGDNTKALEYLNKALSLARKTEDRENEAYVLNALAFALDNNNKSDEAIKTYQQALEIYCNQHNMDSQATVLNNLSLSYTHAGQAENALEAAQQSAKIVEMMGLEELKVSLFGTFGEAYLALNDLENAGLYFQKALTMATEINFVYDKIINQLFLSKVLIKRELYEEAQENLESCLTSCSAVGISKEKYECYEQLSLLHEKKGDFEKALEYHKEFHACKIQHSKQEFNLFFDNMKLINELENAKKDAEINRLRIAMLQSEITQNKLIQNTLEEQAVRDSLTNLHNRRYFLSTGEEVLSEHKKNGRSISIIILDLDHFKNVNDTHGHSVGDEVLKSVADVLRSQCRSTDLISRYGGEEFIVLLPEMDQENAFLMAERFRTSIEDLDIIVGSLQIKITASFGIVSFLKGSNVTLELLINRADQALYLAKDAGRNQSIIYEVSS